MTLKNKKILIIIGGGIAAYKSLDLIRLLRKENVDVRTILTKSGKEFVTSLSLTTLTKNKVYEDLFDKNSDGSKTKTDWNCSHSVQSAILELLKDKLEDVLQSFKHKYDLIAAE